MWERLLITIKNIFASTALTTEDILNIIFSLVLAILISFIISQVYKYTHYGMTYDQSFMVSLVLLGPIVAAIMLFVQGSLVVSLGLIGSLSLIRFRTPIKDSLDMVYIFWVSATGLGCGTYNWMIAIIFSIVLGIVIIIMQFTRYGKTSSQYFVLVINGSDEYPLKTVENILKKYTSDVRIRSHEVEDDTWEAIFEIRFTDLAGEESKQFIQELQSLANVHKISLLAPQLALPV